MSPRASRVRPNLPRRGRSALVWCAVFFAIAQLGMAALIERRLPILRDPEYGIKLSRLRSSLRREPGRPLFLVVGSSRSGLGFRTELLSRYSSEDGKSPLVFNFALPGTGPLMERVYLERLFRDGIRPDRIFLEILPLYLHQEEKYGEENWINVHSLAATDLPILRPYYRHPNWLCWNWATSRAIPWFSNRYGILSHYCPRWLPWDWRNDDIRSTDRFGWKPWPKPKVEQPEYEKATQVARWQFSHSFEGFQVSAVTDRAVRESLEVCRAYNVPVTIYLMPEGSDFRSWYTPEMCDQLDDYFARIERETGVPIINARTWVGDWGFFDSHHLLAVGATTFTERFGAEIVEPIIRRGESALPGRLPIADREDRQSGTSVGP